MKKLFSILAVASLWSCSNDVIIIEDTPQLTAENNVSAVSQKQNAVTFSDIKKYAKPYQAVTRSADDAELSYDFIIDETNDTLLYIVNYADGGWTIYSSDKRLPAVVAESEDGTFNKDEDSPMALWVHTMAEDIKLAKLATDEELSFSAEDIQSNRDNWDAVCDADNFVRNHQAVTRKVFPPIDPTPKGHYELARTERYTEAYDSIGHLTTTWWHQEHPFNLYCPLRSDGQSERAPAGCVAIAGAQMLYYLHYKLGVPVSAPSTVSCTGNVDNYSMSQGNMSSTIWNLMSPQYGSIYEAPLIADVGRLLNMNYGNDASGANPEDLVNNVFAEYGVGCSFGSFSETIVAQNLLNEFPVIANACAIPCIVPDSPVYSNGAGYVGHSFIIDAYKRTRNVTKYTYVWVPDDESNDTPSILLPMDDRIEYTFGSPVLSYIKMNWGWGYQVSSPDLNQWFAVTGAWCVYLTDKNRITKEYNFIHERSMIYNFHVLE